MTDILSAQQDPEALAEHLVRHRMLFEAAPHGIVFQRPDGTIQSANPAAGRILGLSHDQLRGDAPLDPSWTTLREDGSPFDRDDRPGMVALRTGKPQDGVIMGIRHAGMPGTRWIHLSASPLYRPGEETPFQVCVTFLDITERRRLEETGGFLARAEWLRTGEDFFQALARFLAHQTGVDEVCLRRLEGDGPRCETLALWRDGRLAGPTGPGTLDGPDAQALGRTVYGQPESVRGSDIQEHETEGYLGATLWSSRGQPLGLISLRSRTPMAGIHGFEPALLLASQRAGAELENRQSEASLHRSEERFRHLFDHAPVGIFQSTPAGRLLTANATLAHMLGHPSPGDLMAAASDMGTQIYADPLVRRRVLQDLRERDSWVHYDEILWRRKDGSLLAVGMTLRRVPDPPSGGAAYLEGFIEDITERRQALEDLRASEADLQGILASAADGILAVGQDRRIIHANRRFAEIWNIPGVILAEGRDEPVLGHVLAQAEDPEAFVAKVEALYGSEREDLDTLRLKGGRILERYSVPMILDGKVTGRVWSFRDITDRVHAEEELRASEDALRTSEAKYRRLIENNHDIIYTLSAEGMFTFVSPAWTVLLGHAVDQVTGRGFCEFVHPDDIPECLRWLEKVITSGQRQEGIEYRVRDLQGSWHWHTSSAVPILDAGGKVTGYEGTARDITARKEIEEALVFSERKFRTLFENLAEGVALHELVQDDTGRMVDYRILDVNPAYQLHTGLDLATAPGRLGTEVYGTPEPPYLEEFGGVALHGQPYAFETYFPPLDKHFRISVISPRRGQFATVFEDITTRKRREEELKQKNAEMERFTYMVSHDLKSPLVTVRTFLGYLDQDLEQGRMERARKDMDYIRDATGKMGRLLEDLLEVSRVGRVVNPSSRVSLADLMHEAIQAVAGPIATRGVDVRAEAPPVTLYGDRTRLEEIWQNLLENAVKYMGDQPAPRVELGTEGTGPDTVFFVRDNGIGIDPRFQHRIFDLFEKLDATSEGTGLGLALVKRIVELNEGRIWVESDAGQGACFRFTLPLAMKDRKEAARS